MKTQEESGSVGAKLVGQGGVGSRWSESGVTAPTVSLVQPTTGPEAEPTLTLHLGTSVGKACVKCLKT